MIVYLLGVAIFSTHDLKGSKDEVFPSKVEYHMFREDEKDKFIKIKVRSEGPFYIFVSHQENIGKKTHILQYLDSKIILGHFLKKAGKIKYSQLEEIGWSRKGIHHGLWILLQTEYINLGIWSIDNGFTTLEAFKVSGLSEMRYLGLSSFIKTDWTVSNGKSIVLTEI